MTEFLTHKNVQITQETIDIGVGFQSEISKWIRRADIDDSTHNVDVVSPRQLKLYNESMNRDCTGQINQYSVTKNLKVGINSKYVINSLHSDSPMNPWGSNWVNFYKELTFKGVWNIQDFIIRTLEGGGHVKVIFLFWLHLYIFIKKFFSRFLPSFCRQIIPTASATFNQFWWHDTLS